MRNIKWFSCIIFLFTFISCSDFLEEESQDEVSVKTVSDFSEFLLGSGYPQPAIATLYSVLYLLDDDVEINESILNENENLNIRTRFGHFTWQPNMWERIEKLSENYARTYAQITGCNATLDYIDDAIGEVEAREQVKAEALGVRAYFYFMLVNLYGEPYNHNKNALGVPLKLTSGIIENGIERNTVAEVYEQIVKDLSTASDLFEKYAPRRGNYRINLSTVNILLSRAYLYMERWDDAIEAATKAIRYGAGLTDYTRIPDGSTFYMTTYDHSEVEWLYGNGNSQYREGMLTVFRPSEDLMSNFREGDKRRTLWFSSDLSILKKNYQSACPSNTIRLSEAYLNRAEARVLSEHADIDGALADLNALRKHRIVGYQDEIIPASELLEEIRVERRLELCFDELRWFDLRRYGMPSIEHRYRTSTSESWYVYTLRAEDPLYTLPIPNVQLEKNIKLKQNASAYEAERTGHVE
ncbi:MAG: RagB/SusD family nutrient uptake outer membrane protein [Marinifilaceae bacterium]|nr:RagB/SusD family nutrient uptake outer membrane protein [Marinifilaceae bacterium]